MGIRILNRDSCWGNDGPNAQVSRDNSAFSYVISTICRRKADDDFMSDNRYYVNFCE